MNGSSHSQAYPAGSRPASAEHAARIRGELLAAGVTRYGLTKSESRYLPRIISVNEHIGGVVYGWASVGSVMLVATNERIIYLDRKPFFSVVDDISYGVISGVRLTQDGPFTGITLHTRIHDFTIKYVNARCAHTFEHYVTERSIDNPYPFRAFVPQ